MANNILRLKAKGLPVSRTIVIINIVLNLHGKNIVTEQGVLLLEIKLLELSRAGNYYCS